MVRAKEHENTEIFEATRAVLKEQARLTTAKVAARAGISEALLFKRFGSKAALLEEVMEDSLAAMLAVIGELDRAPLDEARLGTLATHVLEHIRVFVPMALAHMGEPLDSPQLQGHDPPPMRALRALSSAFAGQLARGAIRPIDTVTVARAFIGAIWQYAFEEALMRMRGRTLDASPEDLTRNLASFFWSGLAPVTRDRHGDAT